MASGTGCSSGRPVQRSTKPAAIPTPVGGEVHWISAFEVCDSAPSQPTPRPVAAVTAAKVPTVAAPMVR
jgi:hypothetical protein